MTRAALRTRLRDFWVGGRPPDRIGIVAEFDGAPALLSAIERLRSDGLDRLDAYVPYPVAGLERALGLDRSRVPRLVALFGFGAALLTYAFLWWINVVDLPRDVGGRPLHAAPSFIPVVFEVGILVAGTTALIALFVAGGMPRLWHPVFEVEGFESATVDGYWLGVSRDDPAFDAETLSTALEAAGARNVAVLVGDDGR